MNSDQYFNRFLPLGGNIGLAQTATIGVGEVQTSVDLRTLFGSFDNGDGIMVKATQLGPIVASGVAAGNWRALFSLTEKPVPIVESLLGRGSASGAQCWPLNDGQEMLGHLTSGRIVGTGFASQMDFKVLNVVLPAGMGSGLLKLSRTTLVEPQDASRFWPPIPALPSFIASGLVGLPSGMSPRP